MTNKLNICQNCFIVFKNTIGATFFFIGRTDIYKINVNVQKKDMPLRKKLFALRKSKKISQEKLAYDLDIVQSTYSDWENSISVPKRENLLKIANYFEIPITELEKEIYKIAINNKKNAIAVVNSPNVKINATDAILKISDSLEKLTLLVEKLVLKQ